MCAKGGANRAYNELEAHEGLSKAKEETRKGAAACSQRGLISALPRARGAVAHLRASATVRFLIKSFVCDAGALPQPFVLARGLRAVNRFGGVRSCLVLEQEDSCIILGQRSERQYRWKILSVLSCVAPYSLRVRVVVTRANFSPPDPFPAPLRTLAMGHA